jgi:hypothetical protein
VLSMAKKKEKSRHENKYASFSKKAKNKQEK